MSRRKRHEPTSRHLVTVEGAATVLTYARTPGGAVRKAIRQLIRQCAIRRQPRSLTDGGFEGVSIAVVALLIMLALPAAAPAAPELLDFTATWCQPCQRMAPIVEAVGRRGFPVKKIDVDTNRALAARYRVGTLPCFVVVDGDREIARRVGESTELELLALFPPARTAARLSQFRMRGNFAPEFLKRAEAEANKQRRELALAWLGHELPTWSAPCDVELVRAENTGGGSTSFVFEGGRAEKFSGKWEGTENAILENVLPHEVLHTVFASHFCQPLPRWCDEGAATAVETPAPKKILAAHLIQALQTGRAFSTDKLITLADYPADVPSFYAQSFSLADFLIEANGQAGFVGFIEDAFSSDWTVAIKQNFDYGSTTELQNAWLEWVKAASPRAPHEVGYRAKCGCYRWNPLRRLWEKRAGFVFPKRARQQPTAPRADAPLATAAAQVTGPPQATMSPQGAAPDSAFGSIVDRIKADADAKLQSAVAAAEAEKQKLRDDLAAQLGISQSAEAKVDELLAKAKSAVAAAPVEFSTLPDPLGIKGQLEEALAQLATTKTALSASQGFLAPALQAMFGVAAGPAGWIATGLTVGASALAGRWSKGFQTPSRSTVAGALIAAAPIGADPAQGMSTTINTPAANPIQRINRAIPVVDNTIDKAWADAHALIMEAYPGSANALQMAVRLKDQIRAGIAKSELSF